MNKVDADSAVGPMSYSEWITDQLAKHLPEEEWSGLVAQVDRIAVDPNTLTKVFTAIPRTIRSADKALRLTADGMLSGGSGQLPLLIKDWSLARLIRVWVLTQTPALEQSAYVSLIERLFKYGEMEELAALYAALPVYHYPTAWIPRCTEGIRSNMAPVREAIMLNNHYPSQFLDEGAWNQLVLKAFFTDAEISQIIGLKARSNAKLAGALVDYAYELYAARRAINPFLWILVMPFLDDRAYRLMKRLIQESQDLLTRKAIAFAFRSGHFAAATDFIAENGELSDLMSTVGTPWDGWADQTK